MSKNEEEEIIFILFFNDILSQQQTHLENLNNQVQKKPNYFDENLKNEKIFKLNKKSTISNIKIHISDANNVSSEKIHIFIKNDKENKIKNNDNKNKIIIMQRLTTFDYDKKLMEELKDDTEQIGKYLDILDYKNIKDNSPCFYFIISNNDIENIIQYYSVSVIIDFYQQNIDKIFLTLQSNCSIFLLKNIINSKLNNTLNISQLKLFCIDITQINNDLNTKNISKNNNNVFSDRKTLYDIIDYFYPLQTNNNMKYSLHFLLTIKNEIGSSEQIGLNFRFNYLKDVSKISFDKNAPKYCECSDGINLFIFCFNRECLLFNKYFVVNLGYGLFNILKPNRKIKCPKCGDNNNIEIKNIGIINSKYFYSGKLKVKEKEKEKDKSSFEGDGITLDDKLYIFKEAKINSFLVQLYIEAKPHFMIKNKNFKSKRTKEEEELDDIALCDNNIDVNINKKKNYNNNALHTLFTASTLGFDKYISGISSKSPQRFLKNTNLNNNNYQLNNSNKVKIYENESEILEKNDNIIVDKFDDKSINNVNSINCIGDADIFSGGCFSTKKENEFRNNIEIEKSSFCFIF
jgi:hypothetical protein